LRLAMTRMSSSSSSPPPVVVGGTSSAGWRDGEDDAGV
jgi:hypothetical protein